MSKPRFIGRREYFGSLFYDFQRGDYIPFDWDATYIFELKPEHTLDEIAEKIKKRISRESFLTFVQLCQSIELFDANKEFVGKLLPYMPVKGRLSAPLKVHLQLTNKCELECKYCSQDDTEEKKDQLTLQEIFKLIDEMVSIGCFELVLGGGDPFLRDEEELLQIIQYASDKGVSIQISTTGLFIGRVLAKRLMNLPIKGIRISFDGSTEKSFDYQRGKGTYRKVVRTIKTLRELFNCPITLHTVLLKSNYTEILSFVKAVQKLKCNEWSVDFVKPVGEAKKHKSLLLSESQMKECLQTIERIQKFSSTKIKMASFPYQSRNKRIYQGYGCSGGNLNCWIDSTGNVYPCSFLRDSFHAGNIREHSLRDIWIYSANLSLFRNITGGETCKECRNLNFCKGGCRARSLYAGDINSIDPVCFLGPDND